MPKARPPLPPSSDGGKLMKMWYRIGEAADLVGEEPHVLRYWETEFRALRPQKSSKGQRVYSRRDIETALKIKSLLREQRFSIEGAKKRLRLGEAAPAEDAQPSPASAPAPSKHREALVELRSAIATFLDKLEREP